MSTGTPREIQLSKPSLPVYTSAATGEFTPDVWIADWAKIKSTKLITATLQVVDANEEGGFTGLDPSSIELNGEDTPVSSCTLDEEKTTLTLQFYRAEAVKSLQTPVVAGRFLQTIEGKIGQNYFKAQIPILIVDALNVTIDIKPGAYPKLDQSGIEWQRAGGYFEFK